MILDYIKDLWNGKIKLYIVFWIYDMAVGILINMFTVDKYNSISDISSFISFLILYIYSFFINKVLWSSATNYKGKLMWSIIVKILVILDLIWLLVLLPLRIFNIIDFSEF